MQSGESDCRVGGGEPGRGGAETGKRGVYGSRTRTFHVWDWDKCGVSRRVWYDRLTGTTSLRTGSVTGGGKVREETGNRVKTFAGRCGGEGWVYVCQIYLFSAITRLRLEVGRNPVFLEVCGTQFPMDPGLRLD